MELRHLRYAIAVAEELNFGRAAARLNMSQPPLSQQIRQLEEELGVQLFHRTKRSVKITAAGETFVAKARAILKYLDDAATATKRMYRGELGTLMVGTVTSTDSGFYRTLVDILHRFSTHYPDVHIGLQTMSVAQQVHDLKEGRLTVGFVTLPVDDPDLVVRHVRSEALLIALPKKHPLTRQKRISARAVAHEPHVLCPRHINPGYFDQVLAYFQKAGHPLNTLREADNLYTSLALVAAGVGLSLLPSSLFDVPRKGIVVRKMEPAPPSIRMGIAYRRSDEGVLSSFLETLNAFFEKQGRRLSDLASTRSN